MQSSGGRLFASLPGEHTVWMSHRDTVFAPPPGFTALASSTASPVAFDPYAVNRSTGSFILIDRFTNETAGAGMIVFGLRRASNIHWQALTVGRAERAALKEQVPAVLWLTGLPGSGKSPAETPSSA